MDTFRLDPTSLEALSITRAARLLRVRREVLAAAAQAGELRTFVSGSRNRLTTPSDIRAWLDARMERQRRKDREASQRRSALCRAQANAIHKRSKRRAPRNGVR